MKVKKEVLEVLGEKVQFVQGNIACIYGALIAGCRFFAGYPITPASEIAEEASKLLPKLDGCYIQMEDEIASIAAIIGASFGGVKSMTATSGPGFSLMQENIGYACMTETPIVIAEVQRSGPSTGQPTLPAQGDIMQCRWGTHGDHGIITISPNSVQECFNLSIEAFSLAEKYRNPVILLFDAEIAHMREKLIIPEEINLIERKKKSEEVPPFGSGSHIHLTGLTHGVDGIPNTTNSEVHEKLVTNLDKKAKKEVEVESKWLEDSKLVVISSGIVSRPAFAAVRMAREKGLKVGYLRLVNIWPFPYDLLSEINTKFLVPELNLGQLVHSVRECSHAVSLPKIGGKIHTPEEIFKAIKENYD